MYNKKSEQILIRNAIAVHEKSTLFRNRRKTSALEPD